MKVSKMKESGYKEAVKGISLSYNKKPSTKLVNKLAKMDGGHNKFLESIIVWLDIVAPRYWWQQFDAYRVGVTKQSESTMHTMMNRKCKNPLTKEDFEGGFISPSFIMELNDLILLKHFNAVKSCLPESFLQRRIVCTNYKALRTIYMQRKNHKLKQWKLFCSFLENKLDQWDNFFCGEKV